MLQFYPVVITAVECWMGRHRYDWKTKAPGFRQQGICIFIVSMIGLLYHSYQQPIVS